MSAHHHLNYRQVGEFVKRANAGGGFSVKALGTGAGTEAENMHMVGGQARGLDIYPPEVGHDVEATAEQGLSYIEDRKLHLAQPGRYWGGWHGGNRISFDVSRGFPLNTEGEVGARTAALTGGEEAIGTVGRLNTDRSQSYSEISNPYYGKSTSLNTGERAWVNEPRTRKRQGSQ
jgi:hypothetical protein